MKFIRQFVEKLCVVITIVLVYENALVFYQYLFPYWWTHKFYRKFFFHLIIGHWLLISTIRHYYLAITVSPGFVVDVNKKTPKSYSKCSKCNIMRPPRAHHCRVCNKCVLRYDHHCPWINNCVGYKNHVHFFLFCIYMPAIAAYAAIIGQKEFQLAIFRGEVLFNFFAPILQPYDLTIKIIEYETIGPITGVLMLFLFIINLVAMALILTLAVWQMNLITKGQTCVEETIDIFNSTNAVDKKQRRPYDLGWKRNWSTFFEINSITELFIRLLIPLRFYPQHDGAQWISKFNE